MAELPEPQLVYQGQCPDCGRRVIGLPERLFEIRDDFAWDARDYEGFRIFMLEELAARFPERTRWTPADMEVVLVEIVAAVLDQYSDMLDRVAAEAFLETARRPESVRRLLWFIGYDAVRRSIDRGEIPATLSGEVASRALESYWLANPSAMDDARRDGPRMIHTQFRMVTLEDYAGQLEEHPLVLRAQGSVRWTGSWNMVEVAVIAWDNRELDEPLGPLPDDLQQDVGTFHADRELPPPDWSAAPTLRGLLQQVMEACRMQGQEVVLRGAVPVPVTFSLSVQVGATFYRSEVRHAIEDALGTGSGGFFEPGRLRFGEDLHVSDLMQVLTTLEGVENVCVNRFKRLGSQYADAVAAGTIRLEGLEVAVCDNDTVKPARGYYRLVLHGGLPG